MGKCQSCGRTWVSKSECHCSGCCEHFKGVFAFDKHRVGQKDGRRCLSIEEMLDRKMIYDEERKYWLSGKRPEGSFSYSGKGKIGVISEKTYQGIGMGAK